MVVMALLRRAVVLQQDGHKKVVARRLCAGRETTGTAKRSVREYQHQSNVKGARKGLRGEEAKKPRFARARLRWPRALRVYIERLAGKTGRDGRLTVRFGARQGDWRLGNGETDWELRCRVEAEQPRARHRVYSE